MKPMKKKVHKTLSAKQMKKVKGGNISLASTSTTKPTAY